jgi:glycosyltransferase involved in cell wall biosynthesis
MPTSQIPKISVIVTVYNTEQYLEKCLQSLIDQTIEEIEIIVVNDGSCDNAQAVIDNFAREYPGKIKSLRQENKGLGPARNFGLEHAGGEYIGFVDSDDWVRSDMFLQMYKKAIESDSDIVICDITCITENKELSWTAAGYRGFKPNPVTTSDFMLFCIDPAFA